MLLSKNDSFTSQKNEQNWSWYVICETKKNKQINVKLVYNWYDIKTNSHGKWLKDKVFKNKLQQEDAIQISNSAQINNNNTCILLQFGDPLID